MLTPLLLSQPGGCADLGPAAQGFVAASHLQRRGLAGENLAWKVEAEATVLEAAERDAALVDSALAPACLPQLVAAATAKAILHGITLGAIPAADSS